MAHSAWTGGSVYTGQAALPHKNIHGICQECMRQLGDYSKNIQVMMSNQEIKTLGELTDEWWGNQDNE